MSNKHPDLIEGPEAFALFRAGLQKVLTVPKSAMPPTPFKKQLPKAKRSSTRVVSNVTNKND